MFSCEYSKILRTLILMKIWEQLLLQFLLLTVNISSWALVSALNSIGLHQRSSSRSKGFSLGCLVVGFSLIWKKEKVAEMVTRSHSLSLVVIRCHSLYHSLSLDVPLVCLFINDQVSLSVCLYFMRYWTIRVLQLFVNQTVTSWILK